MMKTKFDMVTNSACLLSIPSALVPIKRAHGKNGANPLQISRPFSGTSISAPPSLSLSLQPTTMHRRDPAVAAPAAASAAPKRRGSYNCGRCGLPKKGHVCPSPDAPLSPPPPPPRSDHPHHRLRRALSFDNIAAGEELELDLGYELTPPTLEAAEEGAEVAAAALAEVLRRLSPKELMGAAAVCRGWRECVSRVWLSAEELKLRVSPRSPIGFVGSVLHKCSGLVRLALTMESDADSTVLACVAFSCPNLESFEINMGDNAVNRITGDELSRFVAEKRSLSILKVEGCNNLGFLNLCSSNLSTLWLSDLYCISKAVINCPNLKELSLDFTRQENDTTDLVTMMDSLGHTCPRLRNMHVASIRLCNEAVLALAGANLRGLQMLSLVLGSRITDASVAAIVSCCTSLELLDLSGSSISDSGIGMICNVFPQTLSRLLLALCPNVSSNGIQFATAQLPLLQLIDCGMSLQDFNTQNGTVEEDAEDSRGNFGVFKRCQKIPRTKPQVMNQKLIIKHGRLKKLSLWGCSGLDALYLNCPELNDLNLNSCTNLHPERLLLQCPNLKNVHASGCQDMLVGAIRNQILNEFATVENHFRCKRLADGSKRVLVPYLLEQQPSDEDKQKRLQTSQCTVHVD